MTSFVSMGPTIGSLQKETDSGMFTNTPTKNINFSHNYFIMTNPKGRVVPIADHNLNWALRNGFIHTDGKMLTDDPKDAAVATTKSPTEQLAAAATAMATIAGNMVPQVEAAPAQPTAFDDMTAAELREQIKLKGGRVFGNPAKEKLIKTLVELSKN